MSVLLKCLQEMRTRRGEWRDRPSQGWSVLVEGLDIELETIAMDDFLLAQLLEKVHHSRIVAEMTFFPILIVLKRIGKERGEGRRGQKRKKNNDKAGRQRGQGLTVPPM
jgi:hypothetical protein